MNTSVEQQAQNLSNFRQWAGEQRVINVLVGGEWIKCKAEDVNGDHLNLRVLPCDWDKVCSDLVVISPWDTNFKLP